MDEINDQANQSENTPQQVPTVPEFGQYAQAPQPQYQQAPQSQYQQPQYQVPQYQVPQYQVPQYQQAPQPQYQQQYYANAQQGYMPPAGSYVAPVPVGYNQRSKIVAGLLGLFLGTLGVHNFYLGNTGKAIAQLLITLLTFGLGGLVTGIWALIESILILCSKPGSNWHRDANGVELSD